MKILKITSAVIALLLIAVVFMAKNQASSMVNHPVGNRPLPNETPADVGVVFENVQAQTIDGLLLDGWYVPSQNSSLIIMQHGYKYHRGTFIEEVAMFARAGYGVLVTSIRAHENNPGVHITFGMEEMKDLDAWVQFALNIPGINPEKLGMLGESMGGSMVIQYAASHQSIKAVVAHSAFSSLADTIATSVRYFTGLPPFPFAPLIQFWAEQELGIDADAVDAKLWISDISPRPVFIINSLTDRVISPESGVLLYEAAREPKQLWEETGVTHKDFDTFFPEEFESKVVGFFNQYFFPEITL